jgi:hypothetical protein
MIKYKHKEKTAFGVKDENNGKVTRNSALIIASGWLEKAYSFGLLFSGTKTAAATVVVHNPFLSPAAL